MHGIENTVVKLISRVIVKPISAEREALAPLKIRLAETVAKIASDRGLALVVNTASDACPYINPELGEDLNLLVTNALK